MAAPLDSSTIRDYPGIPPVSVVSDDAMQDIIDANWNEIIARVGEFGTQTQMFFVGDTDTVILLGEAPLDIYSITEYKDTVYEQILDTNDYYSYRGTLRRRSDGTYPYTYWQGPVEVVWRPANDEAQRKMALVHLCQIDVNFNPGLLSFRVGEHSETYATGGGEGSREYQREAIFAELATPGAPPVFA